MHAATTAQIPTRRHAAAPRAARHARARVYARISLHARGDSRANPSPMTLPTASQPQFFLHHHDTAHCAARTQREPTLASQCDLPPAGILSNRPRRGVANIILPYSGHLLHTPHRPSSASNDTEHGGVTDITMHASADLNSIFGSSLNSRL
jgi:hypothetical protein